MRAAATRHPARAPRAPHGREPRGPRLRESAAAHGPGWRRDPGPPPRRRDPSGPGSRAYRPCAPPPRPGAAGLRGRAVGLANPHGGGGLGRILGGGGRERCSGKSMSQECEIHWVVFFLRYINNPTPGSNLKRSMETFLR